MRRFVVRALAVVGAAWLAWSAYALVAPEAEDELPVELVRGAAADEPDLVDLMSRQLGAPITSGNRVELLVNGDEIFPPMLAAIREARESVRLLTYVYWQGDIAREFAAALREAAGRGLEVRLLLDAWGAKKMPDALVEALEEAGVDVAWFHPLAWHNVRRINQRTHRKVLVVDGEIGFTGGVGIAAEWTGDARGPDEWRDDHYRVTGPAVRYLDGAFAENWLNATGELLVTGAGGEDDRVPALTGVDPERLLVVPTSPRGDMSPIALIYWTAFRVAERSVDIATPYFVPDPALLEALTATARRGVRVRLLLPGERNDKRLLHWASTTYYAELLDAGVELYLFEPTMTHSKAVVVDERWSLFGSPNFDNRSFELNDEIVLIGDAPTLTAQLRDAFEHDLTRSDRLRADERSTLERLLAALYHVVLVFREQL